MNSVTTEHTIRAKDARPLISIVTAAYDGERFLKRAIESVRAQSFTAYEHILVDDGSRDGTRAIAEDMAREDARLRVLIQPNRGVAIARNRGARAAHPAARYLLFFDQDDCLRPEALALLLRHLETYPDAVAVFGDAIRIDADDDPLPGLPPVRLIARSNGVFPNNDTRLNFAHIIASNPVFTPGQCLIRRDAFARVGGFDQSVAPCDDWNLYLRLALCQNAEQKAVSPFVTLDRLESVTLEWRLHEGNVSHQKRQMRQAKQRLFRQWMQTPEISGAYRALARASFAYGMYGFDAQVCRAWARTAAAEGDWRSAALNLLRAARMEAAALPVRIEALLTPVRKERDDAFVPT